MLSGECVVLSLPPHPHSPSPAMESAKYYRLDQLPEPDYFEIELEKIYQPPPTRLERLQKCVRRYWKVVLLVVLFLVAAVLYAGLELGSRPRLIGIIRPENGQLKELAEVHAQATVTVEDSTTVTTNGDTVTVDVAGVDVNIGNATADTNTTTTNTDTNTDTNTAAGKPVLDLSDKNATSSEAGNIMAEGAAKNTSTTTSGTPKPKPAMQQDDGQVSIHDAPPASNEPTMPIKATFYSGAEGPKACRGHVIAVVNMPKQQAAAQDPAAAGGTTTPAAPTAPACYNFPGEQASGCATFAANKADGCIAQVFAETNCRVFMNTAAFMAEDRPVGGNWRSVRVQCGIPEPDPATLGKPPMMDAITSLQDNDKAKGGGRA